VTEIIYSLFSIAQTVTGGFNNNSSDAEQRESMYAELWTDYRCKPLPKTEFVYSEVCILLEGGGQYSRSRQKAVQHY
jgi:hypothetical protein